MRVLGTIFLIIINFINLIFTLNNMIKQDLFPEQIYIRIGRAGATGNVRCDLYKRIEIDNKKDVQHVVPYDYFFIEEEPDLTKVTVSDLIKRVKKTARE